MALSKETDAPRGLEGEETQSNATEVGLLYPPKEARELALGFITNRDNTRDEQIDLEAAYRLGLMEVEGQVLVMLGQEDLVRSRLRHAGTPLLGELKPITKFEIDTLIASYKVASQYYFDRDLYMRGPGTTPEEERIRGRKFELGKQLGILGRPETVREIDEQSETERKRVLQMSKDPSGIIRHMFGGFPTKLV